MTVSVLCGVDLGHVYAGWICSCSVIKGQASQRNFVNVRAHIHDHMYIIAICLDQIYVMAFTSDLRYSDSRHPHNIEVVAMGETRSILLPDRPGDYSQHKGDIWRLSISEDLGFSVCVRVCNIQNITLVEGGSNGWNIDSVTTYGCTDDVGCKQITQDFDVFRWVDGDSTEDRQRFTLTKISNTPCTF
jgi:hypothetical protein